MNLEEKILKAYEEDDYSQLYDLMTELYGISKDPNHLYKRAYIDGIFLCEHIDQDIKDLESIYDNKKVKSSVNYINLILGKCYYIKEDLTKAFVYLSDAVKYEFPDEQYEFVYGMFASVCMDIYHDSGIRDYLQRATHYYELVKECDNCDRLSTLKNLSDCYMNQNEYEKAYDCLIDLIQLGVKDDILYYYLGICKLNKKDYNDALYYFELSNKYKDDMHLAPQIALCHFHLNQKDKAFKLVEEYCLKTKSIESYYYIISMYEKDNRLDEILDNKIIKDMMDSDIDFGSEVSSMLLLSSKQNVLDISLDYITKAFKEDPQEYNFSFTSSYRALRKENEAIDIINKMMESSEDEEVIDSLKYATYILRRSSNQLDGYEVKLSLEQSSEYFDYLIKTNPIAYDNIKDTIKLVKKYGDAQPAIVKFRNFVYGDPIGFMPNKKYVTEVFKKISTSNSCQYTLKNRYIMFHNKKEGLKRVKDAFDKFYKNDRSISDCNCYVGFYCRELILNEYDEEDGYSKAKDIILNEFKAYKFMQHQNICFLYAYFALKGEKEFSLDTALDLLSTVEGENAFDIELFYLKSKIYSKKCDEANCQKYQKLFDERSKYAQKVIVKYYKQNKGNELIVPFLNNN